jgi:phage-related protein
MAKTSTIKIDTKYQDSGVKAAINNLKQLDGNVSGVKKTFDTLKNLAVFTAISAGIKKAIEVGSQYVSEYADVERINIKLNASLDGNADRFEKNSKLIETLASRTTESKSSVQALVSELASLGDSDSEIEKISNAAVNLSNITGQSLEGAFTQLQSTLSGTSGKLGKLIPEIDSLTSAQLKSGDAVDIVNKKLGKITDSLSTSVSQSITNYKNSIGNLHEALGKLIGLQFQPFLTGLQGVIDKLATLAQTKADFKEIESKIKSGATTTLDEQITYYSEIVARQRKQLAQLEATKSLTPEGQVGEGVQGSSSLEKEIEALRTQLQNNIDSLRGISSAAGAAASDAKAKSGSSVDSTYVELVKANYKILTDFQSKIQNESEKAGYNGESVSGTQDRYKGYVWDFSELTKNLDLGPEGKKLKTQISGFLDTAYDGLTTLEIKNKNLEEERLDQLQKEQDKIEAIRDTVSTFTSSTSGTDESYTQDIISSFMSGGEAGLIQQGLSYIFGGMTDALDDLNTAIEPLIDMLNLVGQVIGSVVEPVIDIMSQYWQALADTMLWLYNNIFVYVGDALIVLFVGIADVFVAIFNTVSAVIRVLTLGLVNLGQASYLAASDYWLDTLSTDDSTASSSSSSGSSASYSGATTNYIYVNNYAPLVGDSSLRDFAREIVDIINEEGVLS